MAKHLPGTTLSAKSGRERVRDLPRFCLPTTLNVQRHDNIFLLGCLADSNYERAVYLKKRRIRQHVGIDYDDAQLLPFAE